MDIYATRSATPMKERIDDWLDIVSKIFVPLDYVSVGDLYDRELRGSIEHRNCASLGVNIVSSTAQSVERKPKRYGFHDEDLFLFVMQLAGAGEVRQDGRRAVLKPGDFVHYDTTRPYALAFEGEFRQLIVNLPRDQIRLRVPSADKTTAVAMSSTSDLGQMLAHFLQTLPAALDANGKEVAEALSGAVLDLISANLRSLPGPVERGGSNLRRYHLDRIKAYVMQHLSNPELNVVGIANALEMSVSSLYRAFEAEPRSVAQMIWDQRLEAARATLADKASRQKSIKEVALEWGFSDPAHFSRAFRQRFGTSPRGLRTDAATAQSAS
jgi:AraC-like DNA-binding protein